MVCDNRAGRGMRLPTMNARRQERRASAGRGAGTGSAKALPRLFGRLPPVCWGTLLQSRPRNHGGLTPAALVHVRLCIAKIAVPSASDLRASRSGGRKPAVRSGGALATAWRNCSGDCRSAYWRPPGHSRYHCDHGGLTPLLLVCATTVCERVRNRSCERVCPVRCRTIGVAPLQGPFPIRTAG